MFVPVDWDNQTIFWRLCVEELLTAILIVSIQVSVLVD